MSPSARWPVRVPKILGADVELGNFLDGADLPSGSGAAAARLLLNEIPGVAAGADPVRWSGASWGWKPRYTNTDQDNRRRFLPEHGGSAYIDLDHLELALPETFSAFDHVAYWRAMLATARTAVTRVNDRLPAGYRVHALANCSDGHGHSYGAHTNVLLTRAAWDNIVRRKPHYLAYLTAFQVSSIVFTGAGKVGSENGRPPVDYQLSQRADFFETMLSEQTTCRRPLVNSRDEALCGGVGSGAADAPALARLHVIFFDATLCQAATLLRAGTLQIVTAMIEAERVATNLALDDALEAVLRWSRDPGLTARSRLVTGEDVTAVDLQQRFLDEARGFAVSHGFDGIVPHAAQILDLWDDTLSRLRTRDFDVLARRLDWILKRRMLERAKIGRAGLDWAAPEIRHLDQLYASLDEGEGVFWAYERSGLVDLVVSHEAVLRAAKEPPDDTRAWTRAHLLRLAGAGRVEEVDWDLVTLKDDSPWGLQGWDAPRRVHLSCPFTATRADNAALFTAHSLLDDVVAALGSEAPDPPAHPTARLIS
jgi:hypothetical protein